MPRKKNENVNWAMYTSVTPLYAFSNKRNAYHASRTYYFNFMCIIGQSYFVFSSLPGDKNSWKSAQLCFAAQLRFANLAFFFFLSRSISVAKYRRSPPWSSFVNSKIKTIGKIEHCDEDTWRKRNCADTINDDSRYKRISERFKESYTRFMKEAPGLTAYTRCSEDV